MTGPDRPYRQVAGGVIVNAWGQMAIVNQCGTSWSLPKGHVEVGEPPLAAAHREAREETGLTDLIPSGELCIYERSAIDTEGSIDDSRWKRITLYLFTAPATALAPEDPHNPEARWVAPRDAAAMLTHPVDRQVVMAALPRIEALARAARASSDGAAEATLREHLQGVPDQVVADFLAMADAPGEELAERAVMSSDKPYGVNHILVDSGDWGVSFARLLPDQSSSFHLHRVRREFFRVRAGTLTLRTGEETTALHSLECGLSTPGIPHSIANNGAEPMEIVEVFSPALLDDKVRISDRYARKLGQVTFGE